MQKQVYKRKDNLILENHTWLFNKLTGVLNFGLVIITRKVHKLKSSFPIEKRYDI